MCPNGLGACRSFLRSDDLGDLMASTEFETILTDIDDGILTMTMNRPDRLNAWTHKMGAELATAIRAGNDNDDVIAMILTGAGRGFCAGADIGDVFESQVDSDEKPDDGMGDWVGLVRSSKPIVAAINGPSIGVGLTQTLSMDSIVAARGAKLSVRFIKMGVVPELASSHFLPLRVGFGQASELMLTGKTILAEEAVEIGLVDKLAEPEQLMDMARATARAMGENPQAALRMVKALITANSSETSLREVQRSELAALDQAYRTPEHKEAIRAFLEKREPDFKTARSTNQ